MEDGKRKHILIVEDAPDLQILLSHVLEREGYKVTKAYNGSEALAYLRAPGSERPSMILLDIMMPVMDGLEFRKLQRSDRELASIPVVAMTAFSNPEGLAEQLGVKTLLKKPISVDTLLRIVESF